MKSIASRSSVALLFVLGIAALTVSAQDKAAQIDELVAHA